jgi:peptide/nickel transport system permease protein
MLVLLVFFGIAILAELYTLSIKQDDVPFYDRGQIEERFQPPNRVHWLGTDYRGRDVLCRALFATRTAVRVGTIATLISALIGVGLGAAAGYFGGWIDDIVNWIYSTFASIPTLLFILAFALLVNRGFLFPPLAHGFATLARMLNTEPGMLAVYLGIGLTGWVSLCRVVRAESMKLRDTAYIQAARALGIRPVKIILFHLIPNLFHLVIIYSTMRFAYAIMTEVIVSYLGLGVQFEPSWGTMIADGQERLWQGIWWEVAAATLFMFLLVLALHTLGDSLRDKLDPRLRT